MKNILRKISLVFVASMMMCLLTGCSAGSTVDTILNIYSDLSGSREMTLVVDQGVYNEYFSGTKEDLNALIARQCPTQLDWSYDDSTGVMVYSFILAFDSPDDYKGKVQEIIGYDSDITLDIIQSDSVWATGVYVEENFTTSSLLEWLQTCLVEEGFVNESYTSNIFSLGNHSVIYGGKEYSTGSSINLDEIEYIEIDSIDLFTDAVCYDSYDETIEMHIPDESMLRKGEEIRAFLEERVPSGATAEWSQTDDASMYQVSKSGMTALEVESFLNEFFSTESCTVVQEDIREYVSPFSFNFSLVEKIDLSNYLVGQVARNTEITYWAKGEDGYIGGDNLFFLQDYYGDIEGENGYNEASVVFEDELLCTCSAYFQKVYKVSDVSVKTSKGVLGDLHRKIDFSLNGVPSEEEQAIILDKIQSRIPGANKEEIEDVGTETALDAEDASSAEDEKETPNEKSKTKVTAKTKEENYVVTVYQSGNREEIKESSSALFDYSGDLYHTEKYSFARLFYPVAMYDSFSFGNFVDYVCPDITSSYTLDMGVGSKVMSSNKSDMTEINSGKLTMSYLPLSGIDLIAYGKQFNIWALCFYLLVAISLVCAFVLLKKFNCFSILQKKMSVEKSISNKKVIIPNQSDSPMFCKNCGAKRDEDALVCTECGVKFED